MFKGISALANCSYRMDRAKFDQVKTYVPTVDEIAAPAAPIVVADCFYGLTHAARVAMRRAEYPHKETHPGWLVIAEPQKEVVT